MGTLLHIVLHQYIYLSSQFEAFESLMKLKDAAAVGQQPAQKIYKSPRLHQIFHCLL